MQSWKLDNTIGPSIESLWFIFLPQWDLTSCKHVFFFCLWLYLLQTNQLPMEDCGWSDSLFTMWVFNPTPSCNCVLILFFWPCCIFPHRYCILCLLHIVYTVHVHKPGCCAEHVNNKMCPLLSNAEANLNTPHTLQVARSGSSDFLFVDAKYIQQHQEESHLVLTSNTINNSEWEERCSVYSEPIIFSSLSRRMQIFCIHLSVCACACVGLGSAGIKQSTVMKVFTWLLDYFQLSD